MKNLFAIAVPILPGKTEAFKKFINELNTTYSAQFAASRKMLGVRERTFLQHTPMGDIVVVTLEGEDPTKAFQDFGAGTDSFTQWFADNVKELHGIDLSVPPDHPMPELIVDSEQIVAYQN